MFEIYLFFGWIVIRDECPWFASSGDLLEILAEGEYLCLDQARTAHCSRSLSWSLRVANFVFVWA